MAFEDLKAEILTVLDALRGPSPDAHEVYERVRQSLDTMKAEGLPLPEDLVHLEERLERAFAEQQRDGSGARQ
ncbi:MAG: hypothetical protein RIM72_07955 [Alphaproteobacteria bacterium]